MELAYSIPAPKPNAEKDMENKIVVELKAVSDDAEANIKDPNKNVKMLPILDLIA